MSEPRKLRALLADAARLLDGGDARAAFDLLAAATAQAPDDLNLAVRAAQLAAKASVPTLGVDMLRRSGPPDDRADAWLTLGGCLLAADCCGEAALAYAHPTAGPPDVLAACAAGWARARLRLGDAASALQRLDGLLQRTPREPELVLDRATALDLLGRGKDALAAWRELLDLVPGHPIAARRLAARGAPPSTLGDVAPDDDTRRLVAWGAALLRDGRADDAVRALDPVLAHADAPLDAFLTAAAAHRARHDAARVLDCVDRALTVPADARRQVALADLLVQIGHPEARARYEAARLSAPEDANVLAGVGAGLLSLGDPAGALAVLDAALALDPERTDALAARAQALTLLGREVEARAAWRRVAEVDPQHPEAARHASTAATRSSTTLGVARIHFDLGRSMLQRGRLREAVAAFRNASELNPDWADPWRQLGLVHARLDDRDAGVTALQRALELDPTDSESAVRLGDLQRAAGQHAAAVASYATALALDGSSNAARLGRAESLRIQGHLPDATVEYEAVLRAAPEDATALAGLAAALNGQRRYAEARAVWARARERDPTSPFVAKGMAQCHTGLRGTTPFAFEDISREPQPKRADAWSEPEAGYDRHEAMDLVDRGRAYHKERNLSGAIDAFRKALDADPTCDEAALRLGMALEDDRQYRRAIAAYRTCLELEPGHYQAMTNVGEAYRKNEQYHEAIHAYDQALDLKPDYPYALAGRAECMRMLGKYDECVGWFDRALALSPNHAFALQGKAAALNALMRFDDAASLWDRALALEPQSQFAADGKDYCEAQRRRIDAPEGDDAAGHAAASGVSPGATTSTTPTLDEQGRDLTKLAREGKLSAVVGRDIEIRQVMKTLVRRLKANPLLLGEPGVGKTAVVEGLAQRLVSGDAPERLKHLRIIELSMGSLIAGTKYRGTFEERLREIVREASSETGLVLFIDEIHTLVGAGRTEGGSLDAANILKPALARGEITVIGATTRDEYRAHFESDSALERRFQPIQVDEPTEAQSIALVQKVCVAYEKHHSVTVEPSAIAATVQLSIRYMPDRRLPDKALDLLDEACAEASLSDTGVVTAEIVAQVVSERTGVPVARLSESERERMGAMETFLESRVVGQQDAVRTLSDAVRLARSGLRTGERPRGVFLFRGPSGVGKTELAKSLADFLFPEGDALVRIDMSEYADHFTVSRLLGAPPGYSGHGEEGQLTGPLRRKPYSVVLLDEFDKAHPDVQAVFLSLLDEGKLTAADGRKVDAREAWFVLTTNAGSDARSSGRLGFERVDGAPTKAAAIEALKPFFRPELLDRVDEVVSFRDLDDEALRRIAMDALSDLRVRAEVQRLTVRWDDTLPRHLASRRTSGDRGARSLLRAVESEVAEPLGRLLLTRPSDKPRTVDVSVADGRVVVTLVGPRGRTTELV